MLIAERFVVMVERYGRDGLLIPSPWFILLGGASFLCALLLNYCIASVAGVRLWFPWLHTGGSF